MKNINKLLIALVLLLFLGCSGDDDSSGKISDRVLSGTVLDNSFTAVGGKAFDSNDEISLNITNIAADCEADELDFDLEVSTYIPYPAEVGTYKEHNVIFNKQGEIPMNCLFSTVIVTSVSDTSISVKIKADCSSENYVEGTFTIPYCK